MSSVYGHKLPFEYYQEALEYLDFKDRRGGANRLMRTNKPALLALLKSSSPDAVAIRQEASDSSKRSRKEA